MNRNRLILFNGLLLLLGGVACRAQEKSKTYKETYSVNKDTELNINTSHADIEFETWEKDQVEISVVVELEGVGDEEAKSYFEKDLVKIMGNSKEIEVSTKAGGPYAYNFKGLSFDFPELPSVDHIMSTIEIPEMPEIAALPEISFMPAMPPMPPTPFVEFDYDAYKKDKEKYLKEWKKKFDKTFDEEYKKRFEEWGKEMEEMAKERDKYREEMAKQREEFQKEREEKRKEMQEDLKQQREELRSQREEMRKQYAEEARTLRSSPNVFYFSSDGENKEYKVKKRIKIKMPKYIKLNMNVRHGEVKLAANTKNINASLSYASLHALTIEGDKTNIRASYSPVVVQQWNYGKLKTDYSDKVNLKEVVELDLSSVSSNVVIGRLASRALVNNKFGTLSIHTISDGFKSLDISVENGEMDCKLPSTPFIISVNEITSDFQYPKTLKLESSKNYGTNALKGYHIHKNGGKSISINSKYSEVVLKE
ncbi:hypothetical protein SAMN04487891_102274 [Flagellimonas taeanensis]|uniref:HMG box domain-containing protein n=1 Tax=Flagellimonas taeanensis TaxID=1005926 RepID=A0A1M6S1I0_9FLAO|nr:hypothetical protein [Allomuricauda taeanensis]SFB77462.1 hypothetical protein SAMN04487891_102274 [Allomuricauda taeanensis]SHK38570.1 hypothetical protein SAMN05216293_0953 [Allomuricauda taeanensis]